MRAFFGGQIAQECRGDLAVVINKREKDSLDYAVFLYPANSEEFVHLTGMGAVNNPPYRVYIGVSSEVGVRIAAQLDGQSSDIFDLRAIDSKVVNPYFLDKNLEKPKRIVLEETLTGYNVVEGK